MDKALDQRLRELAARTLEPPRPRLKEVWALVREQRSPREAWEALLARELLPGGFLENPARRYRVQGSPKDLDAASVAQPRASLHSASLRAAPHPSALGLAVAIASDVQGVLRAEELAREAVARLWPWLSRVSSLSPPQHAVWQSVRRASLLGRNKSVALPGTHAAHDAARLAGGEDWHTERRDGWEPTVGVSTVLMERAAEFALGERAWARAVAADARVPEELTSGLPGTSAYPSPLPVRGERFADLGDPFAPLVELWASGYLLCEYGEDAVLLGASPA